MSQTAPEVSVPLLDLTAQFESIADEIRSTVLEVVEEQKFILGPRVERLEQEVREMLGVEYAIGCASGTDAILLSLRALNVDRGDEVITTPFTFFATAGAIHNVGAKPVFADIDPVTFNLDPAAAEAAVTDVTKAVMPVHLYGQMAAVEEFRRISDRHGIAMVEDAAQAIGATRTLPNGEKLNTGTMGDTAAFSFFPSKNLGGFGDGGMIVTRDADLAERLGRIRVHGGYSQYLHDEVGYNSRLDSLQAAVLSVKLPHLEEWSDGRRRNAEFYDAALADIDEITTPVVSPENRSIFNQYTIRVLDGRRDALREFLQARGVGSAIYYPLPLHLQSCFDYLGHRKGEFPVAERASEEVLSLPIFPELSRDQLDRVAASVRQFFEQ